MIESSHSSTSSPIMIDWLALRLNQHAAASLAMEVPARGRHHRLRSG
jgi:hypothetical protein